MPQLPIYEQQTLGPQGALLPDNVPTSGIGQAVGNFGRALGDVGQAMQRLEDQKGKLEAAALESELSVKLTKSLEDSLTNTKGDPAGLSERHIEGLRTIRDETLEGLADKPYTRKYAEVMFQNLEQREALASMQAEAKARAGYQKTLFVDVKNSIVRNVSADPTAFDEKLADGSALIDGLTLPDSAKAELRAELAAQSAEAALTTIIRANPKEGLQILANMDDRRTKSLTGDDYQRLRHAADMELERRRAAAEAVQAKRENAAARLLGQYEQRISEGVPVSAEALRELQGAVRGTALESEFNALMDDEAEVQRVLRQSPQAQQDYLRAKQAELADSGADLSGRNVRLVNTLTNAISNSQKMLAEAPLELYTQQTGEVFRPLETGTFLNDPGTTASILTDRVNALGVIAKERGGVAPKPLFQEEADNLRATLDGLNPRARGRYLGQMREALGDRMFVGAVGQIYAGDNNAISAGVFAGRNLRTSSGADVSGLILRGAEVLKDKSAKVYTDSDDAFDTRFDVAVGPAVVRGSPERQALLDRTRAIYASMAERDGKMGKAIDESTFRQALNVASGGVKEWAGSPVIAPYGMGGDEFETRVERGLQSAAQASGYPVDALRDLPLLPAGREGAYYIADEGRPIVAQDGSPLVIDVTQAAPMVKRKPATTPAFNFAAAPAGF